ncbi:DnaB-like helicase C-terminal domain-containing protein, partial [Leclercia adecarboxylata]|uniref:DnaB-like helicase C-terminal domain-containing protein n=1 Tax=Leclercia adecarboxylata TaxID=83655 RepID=UPI00234DD136
MAKLLKRFEVEVAATGVSVCGPIRRLVREHGCQCIYVDYLQAIRPTDARLDTRTAIRDAIAECKRAATIGAAEPATLVLLSQMRRREQDTSMPSKSDLYESGY